jgi:hypothetical protein
MNGIQPKSASIPNVVLNCKGSQELERRSPTYGVPSFQAAIDYGLHVYASLKRVFGHERSGSVGRPREMVKQRSVFPLYDKRTSCRSHLHLYKKSTYVRFLIREHSFDEIQRLFASVGWTSYSKEKLPSSRWTGLNNVYWNSKYGNRTLL